MPPVYELFDRETANQIGTYESAKDALLVIRLASERGASADLGNVALGIEDEHGDTFVIAEGYALVQIAIHGFSALASASLKSTPVRNGSISGKSSMPSNVGPVLSTHVQ